jgi:phenylacetate-CoA ligase
MYSALYKHVLLPAYDTLLRRRATLRHLSEFERTQWLPREEVERRQWEGVLAMLRHAAREVPYYREGFAAAGVRVEDVQAPEDFARLPLLEKATLRERPDDLVAASYRGKPLIASRSGGSTGQPVEFRFHRDHYVRRLAAWWRADRWAGWDLGTRQIVLWLGVGTGAGDRHRRDVWKEHLHWALMRWKVCTATQLSREKARLYWETMCRFRPTTMYGLAQSAHTFALLLEEQGLQPPPMRGIILGAEKVFPHQRARIEQVFGTPTFERYGCQEFCNIAAECDRHDGMHLNADGLYVEVVGPDGRPVPPGETGEVVITSLDNYAMPFIRYRIGDMGALAVGDCPCGRGLPRIKEIAGRCLDMIVTAEGTIVSGVMVPHLVKQFAAVRAFQLVQDALDSVVLRVVAGPGFDGAQKASLGAQLRRWLGPGMSVRIEERRELETAASGKYRLVISDVDVLRAQKEAPRSRV